MRSVSSAGATNGSDPKLHQAAEQLETLLLRQVVVSSGAFGGGDTAGSAVRAGLFADTLAEALAKSGGMGLADQIERSLGGKPAIPAAVAAASPQVATSSPRGFPAPVPGPAPGQGVVSSNLPRVTSGFGTRHDPFTGVLKQHNGVDLSAPEGTPIPAAAAGVVKSAGPRNGYGNAVEIDHGNGVTTIYGHASEVMVRPGEQVAEGQTVARVGHTGHATGPHLHLEVRVKDRPVDPTSALKRYSMRADEIGERGP